MCGLIGFASNEDFQGSSDRKNFIRDGLVMSSLRGSHSTGIALVPKDPANLEAILYKRAIHPFDFVDTKGFEKSLVWIEKFRYILGHTRWATIGKINQETAHPFHYDGVYMIHNGTLVDWRQLAPDQKFVSDSEALCYMLSEWGPEETFAKVQGAFAVVWADTRTGKMHMIRNEERSLSFATIKNEDTIVFASEVGMMKWCAARSGMPIKEVYSLDPGHLLTLLPEGKLENWHYEKIKLAKKPVARIQQVGFVPTDTTTASGTGQIEPAAISRMMASLRSRYPSGKTIRFTISECVQKSKKGKEVGFVRGYSEDGDWTVVESVEGVQLEKIDKDFVYTGKVHAYVFHANLPSLILNKVRKTQDLDPWLLNQAEEDVKAAMEDNQDDMILGPDNKLITESDWLAMTKHGCSFCSVHLDLEDAEDVHWTSEDQPLCTRCLDDWTAPEGKFSGGQSAREKIRQIGMKLLTGGKSDEE